MKLSKLVKLLLFTIIIILIQIFIPAIHVYGIDIVPDILLIYLTYIGYYYKRYETIIVGFALGFIQDFTTQVNIIGVMSLAKSLSAYGFGLLGIYNNIWSLNFRIIFIFIIYVIHFIIYNYIRLNGAPISVLLLFKIIIFHSMICFSIFCIIDRSIFNNGIHRGQIYYARKI